MAYGEIARGLRDVKGYPIVGGAIQTGVDIPGARSLDWSIDQDSDQLDGDDIILAVSLDAGIGSGTLEWGRNSLAGLAALRGGTAVTTGVTPNQVITLEEGANGGEDYVMLVGQAMSRDTAGSAYRAILHKCQIASPSETLANKAWNTPSATFQFFENDDSKMITRVQYETAIDIPTTWV